MNGLGRTARESNLETFFRKQVRLAGGHTIKLAPTEAGVPDRLVIFPEDRLFLVELKREDTSLRPIQRVWHERMRAQYHVHVYTLHGRDGILAWLRQTAPDAGDNRAEGAAIG